MKHQIKYALDVQTKTSVYERTVTQNDTIEFIITMLMGGEKMDLTGVTPSLAVKRLDGTVTVLDGTVDGNVITFNLGSSETAKPGRTQAVVQLYDANGRVSSLPFSFCVSADFTAAGFTPSENERTLIEVVLQDGPGILDRAERVVVQNETHFKGVFATVAERDAAVTSPTHGDTATVADESTGISTTYRYVDATVDTTETESGWKERDRWKNATAINNLNQQLADTERVINVKFRGAVGDGVTDNWKVIQDAVTLAEATERSVYIPSGVYYVSKPIRTSHKTTPHYQRGIRIYGDGKNTRLIGRGATPADYSNLNTISEGAIFALHSGNNIIEKMEFRNCTIGVFFGQHPDVAVATGQSSASFNVIRDIWMEYVGTGILMVHSMGNNYNKFLNVHILNCQIGVHLGKGVFVDRVNNNRNSFRDIRVARAWIGYLVDEADGNGFSSIYAESLVAGGGQVGPAPSHLPAEVGGKPTALVVKGGQYNFFDIVGFEACDFHIYSVGFRTSFDNLMVKNDNPNDIRVVFPDPNPSRQPTKFMSDSYITPFYQYQPSSGILHNGAGGLGFTRRTFDLGYYWQPVLLENQSTEIQSTATASRSRLRRLAGMFDWATNVRFTKAAGVPANAKVRIMVPYQDKVTIDPLYTNEVSSLATFSFPVYVGVSGALQMVRGRFSSTTEATAYGGVHIIIDPPTTGWHDTLQANNIIFNLNYYAEDKV